MLTTFPLMAVALIVYNGIAFGMGVQSVAGAGPTWADPLFSFTLISGQPWQVSLGDAVLALGLFLLFFEILKATRVGRLSIVDHLLSTLVLILFLIEFLAVPAAGTSIFFLLMLMTLVDVMAGFSVSIRTATRDVSLGEGGL
ncbi:MAG: hypothetical protein AAFO61_02220 [Pseudomonadota bacterium]